MRRDRCIIHSPLLPSPAVSQRRYGTAAHCSSHFWESSGAARAISCHGLAGSRCGSVTASVEPIAPYSEDRSEGEPGDRDRALLASAGSTSNIRTHFHPDRVLMTQRRRMLGSGSAPTNTPLTHTTTSSVHADDRCEPARGPGAGGRRHHRESGVVLARRARHRAPPRLFYLRPRVFHPDRDGGVVASDRAPGPGRAGNDSTLCHRPTDPRSRICWRTPSLRKKRRIHGKPWRPAKRRPMSQSSTRGSIRTATTCAGYISPPRSGRSRSPTRSGRLRPAPGAPPRGTVCLTPAGRSTETRPPDSGRAARARRRERRGAVARRCVRDRRRANPRVAGGAVR